MSDDDATKDCFQIRRKLKIKLQIQEIQIKIRQSMMNQVHPNLIQLSYSKRNNIKIYSYDVLTPSKPIDIDVEQNVYFQIIRGGLQNIDIGLQNMNDNKAPKEDELAIDSVFCYISKIKQYTEKVDDEDEINKKEDELEEQQNVVKDLEELIIQKESEIQIIKPVFSKDIYTQKELQNGIRILFIQSTIE